MDTIDSNYKHYTVCNNDHDMFGSMRCGKAGVSIFYKKSLTFNVIPLEEVQDDRVIGIEMYSSNNSKLFMFCVYMPPANYPNTDYDEYVNMLHAIINSYADVGTVIILGDMNGENVDFSTNKNPSYRDKCLSKLMYDNDMMSLVYSPNRIGPAYTYLTMEKMLDHVIIHD